MKKSLFILIFLFSFLICRSQEEDELANKAAVETLNLIKAKDYKVLYNRLENNSKPKFKAFKTATNKVYDQLADASVNFEKYRVVTISKNISQYRFLMLPQKEDPIYFALNFKDGNFLNVVSFEVLVVEVVYH